jgi:NlpC/P60 family
MATISGTQIVAEVEKFAGDAYVYGAAGPSTFDCSGLVQYVLQTLGVQNVPRTSEEQYAWATKISQQQLEPGDLVFAQFPGDNASPGHVGVYTGNGEVLSAEDPASGVGYDTLSDWGSAIVGYGRVPDSTAGTAGASTDASVSTLGGILSWPSDITGFFDDAKTFLDAAMWLVKPSSWVRIGSFVFGVFILLMAFYIFTQVGSGDSITAPITRTAGAVPI